MLFFSVLDVTSEISVVAEFSEEKRKSSDFVEKKMKKNDEESEKKKKYEKAFESGDEKTISE